LKLTPGQGDTPVVTMHTGRTSFDVTGEPLKEQMEAFKAPIRQKYEDEGNPYHATARLWDDENWEPYLELALSSALATSLVLFNLSYNLRMIPEET